MRHPRRRRMPLALALALVLGSAGLSVGTAAPQHSAATSGGVADLLSGPAPLTTAILPTKLDHALDQVSQVRSGKHRFLLVLTSLALAALLVARAAARRAPSPADGLFRQLAAARTAPQRGPPSLPLVAS